MVEDSEDDALLIERVIKNGGYAPRVKRVSNAAEMSKALDGMEWDVVLCDYMMPSFTVTDALELVKESGLDTPFIIVSGAISDEVAVEMMKAGAHDYLNKDNLSRLVPAIKREIAEAKERRMRREAELALKDSEQRYRTLVESLSDTIYVLEEECVISEHYGPNVLVGERETDLAQAHLSSVLPGPVVEKIGDLSKDVLSNGQSFGFQFPHDSSSQTPWFSVRLNPHEDGKRVVLILSDVTDLKHAEEEARAAHGVALLYQDITGHDIRNAMQAILIASDLLASDESDSGKAGLIDHINDAVVECSDLISTVQGTATLLSTPLEKTSLDFTLKSCLDVFSKEHSDVMIERKLRTKDAIIKADQFLNNLILNVLSNAVRHSERTDKRVWVELREESSGYEIDISDNGPGISDDMKKNLLNPDRRSGGVGIHQCMQIVSKYGGKFEVLDRVEGNPEEGARISIWLPNIGFTQVKGPTSTFARQEL
jgi:nitrogen fixation/metabolism regulation signal transduction histidine kinase